MTSKKSVEKDVDVTPHISLMPKLGASGYKVPEAIAELIENSIDARIPDEKLVIRVELTPDHIRVSDNGGGMDEKTAIDAMRLAASKKKKDKLGRFGLGLKTACTSLGQFFKLETTERGSKERYILEFNESEWLSKGDWKKQKLKIEKSQEDEHGTTLTIKDLKFSFYPMMVTNYRRWFSKRFNSFIINKEISIKVNRVYCGEYEYDLIVDPRTGMDKHPFKKTLEEGNDIHGWYGFLKTRATKGGYGFNLFSGERLIEENVKIGFEIHPDNARIFGEIHLDHVPISHNKREFIKESISYKIAEKAIEELIKENKIKIRSREIGRKKTIKRSESKVDKKLDMLEIPLDSDLSAPIKCEAPVIDKIIESGVGDVREIRYNDKVYKYIHHLESLGKDQPWRYVDIRNCVIHIFTNFDSLMINSSERPMYSFMNTIEAISKAIVEREGWKNTQIIEVRDNILLKLSKKLFSEQEKEKLSKQKEELKKEQKKLEDKLRELS